MVGRLPASSKSTTLPCPPTVQNSASTVKFHLEDLVSELQAVTKDVSIGGLLLESASPIPQRCPVDFVMTLHGGSVTRPIQVMGEGEVVRVEPHGLDAGFAIAIKCKRELQLNLPELAS